MALGPKFLCHPRGRQEGCGREYHPHGFLLTSWLIVKSALPYNNGLFDRRLGRLGWAGSTCLLRNVGARRRARTRGKLVHTVLSQSFMVGERARAARALTVTGGCRTTRPLRVSLRSLKVTKPFPSPRLSPRTPVAVHGVLVASSIVTGWLPLPPASGLLECSRHVF